MQGLTKAESDACFASHHRRPNSNLQYNNNRLYCQRKYGAKEKRGGESAHINVRIVLGEAASAFACAVTARTST